MADNIRTESVTIGIFKTHKITTANITTENTTTTANVSNLVFSFLTLPTKHYKFV